MDAKIFCEMPPGFGQPGFVIKLKKALEGIKQGAFLWFNRNKDALEKLGFQCTHAEPNLYRHALLRIIIGVFANNILVAYDAAIRAQYERIKLEYSTYIKIEHLKIVPVALFCGIEIERDRARKTLTICQSRYITLAFEEYKSQGAREISNPYGSTAEREAFEKLQPPAESDRIDTTKMLKICGKLVWAASMTRPDITYAVGVLCSFGQTAGPAHYAAALRVLGYLHKTRDIGITYGGNLKTPLGLAAPPSASTSATASTPTTTRPEARRRTRGVGTWSCMGMVPPRGRRTRPRSCPIAPPRPRPPSGPRRPRRPPSSAPSSPTWDGQSRRRCLSSATPRPLATSSSGPELRRGRGTSSAR